MYESKTHRPETILFIYKFSQLKSYTTRSNYDALLKQLIWIGNCQSPLGSRRHSNIVISPLLVPRVAMQLSISFFYLLVAFINLASCVTYKIESRETLTLKNIVVRQRAAKSGAVNSRFQSR